MTLAELMATALSLGAQALAFTGEEAAKSLVGETVKDAYNNLKGKVASWAPGEVEQLEGNPTSKGRHLVVVEAIEKQSSIEQSEGAAFAQTLLDALEKAANTGSNPIGIDIGVLRAARVKLGEITVDRGTGFRAREIVTPGDFETGPIRVGTDQGK